MKIKQKTQLEGFAKAYDLLPAGVQSNVRDKIKDTCDWQAESKECGTFHNKRKGASPINKLEAKALKTIFAKYNIDVATGEYL